MFAVQVWPLYQDKTINPLTDLTADEYEIVRAFDSGMHEYYDQEDKRDTPEAKARAAKSKLQGNAVVMGGLPDDLIERGQVSSMSLAQVQALREGPPKSFRKKRKR